MESKEGVEAFPSFEQNQSSTVEAPTTVRRGRKRSNSIRGENPLETPITPEETSLAKLAEELNKHNRVTSIAPITPPHKPTLEELLKRKPTRSDRPPLSVVETSRSRGRQPSRPEPTSPGSSAVRSATVTRRRSNSDSSPTRLQAEFAQARASIDTMNYQQNYVESPQVGQGSGPRQAPPSPSQSMNTNGMNGGGVPYGMPTFPTPAGHQADLNFIMHMVEGLSDALSTNRKLTADITEKMGLIRERAIQGNFSNEELLAIVSDDVKGNTRNLDMENSKLRKALDQALYDKDENWKIVLLAKNILDDTLDKVHDFRVREDARVLAWHKSYRDQLAEERNRNLELNNRILDMQEHAAKASEYLRKAQRLHDDSPEWQELHIQNDAYRKEIRYWKRMAMPLIPDDSDFWSDDDDLIDPEEKKRLARVRDENQVKYGKKTDGGEGPGGSA